MMRLEHMYWNSLQNIQKYYNEAIDHTLARVDEDEPLDQIIDLLVSAVTKKIFNHMCMGLFEEHKLILSFFICSDIQIRQNIVKIEHWNFLIRSQGILNRRK